MPAPRPTFTEDPSRPGTFLAHYPKAKHRPIIEPRAARAPKPRPRYRVVEVIPMLQWERPATHKGYRTPKAAAQAADCFARRRSADTTRVIGYGVRPV